MAGQGVKKGRETVKKNVEGGVSGKVSQTQHRIVTK